MASPAMPMRVPPGQTPRSGGSGSGGGGGMRGSMGRGDYGE